LTEDRSPGQRATQSKSARRRQDTKAATARQLVLNVHIRLATAADGPRLAAIYRPAVVSLATSFELAPPTGSEMARRLTRITARTPWLVAEDAGEVLGYAHASAHRERPAYAWSVEVSAYVDPTAQRRGIGRALYTSLLAILTLQGYQNAYAGITLPNPASLGFHEALGFASVGTYPQVGYKHGRWHDVQWYDRPLGAHPTDPPRPRLLPEIMQVAGFARALAAGERTSVSETGRHRARKAARPQAQPSQ
jgi:L-amino acid N-acyltransferase YncA